MGLYIKSAVFKSFCHSHASGNLEIVPIYINLDSRSCIKYGFTLVPLSHHEVNGFTVNGNDDF